jgi:beta-carotene ketolase (CrtW type)
LTGLLIASLIVVLWISSLGFLSFIDIAELSPLWILPAIVGRTFIQTGLFIIAHDAIHGSVFSNNRRLNHLIGRLAVTLYAFLSYRKLSLNHWQHHRYPGQLNDPDFHNGIYSNVFAWYLKFMKEYIDAKQRIVLFWAMGVASLILHSGFHVPVANLLLFWLLPIFLSSIQLFFFGTYLPHRSNDAENSHHATSSNYPLIWSFLACYHFGYHWEHHEYPSLPWYRLPSARRPKPQKQRSTIVIGKPFTFRLATTSPLLTLLLIITC